MEGFLEALASRAEVFLQKDPCVHRVKSRLKEELRRRLWKAKRLAGYPLDVNYFNRRSLGRFLERAGCRELGWYGEAENFANVVATFPDHEKGLSQRDTPATPSHHEEVADQRAPSGLSRMIHSLRLVGVGLRRYGASPDRR